MAFAIFCVICSTSWPCLYCYYASQTVTRMACAGDFVYGSAWFNLPLNLQKYIIVIIARSQEELCFTGLGIIYCTLVVLGKVCTTFSYFNSCKFQFTDSLFSFRSLDHRSLTIWCLERCLRVEKSSFLVSFHFYWINVKSMNDWKKDNIIQRWEYRRN